MRTSLTSLLKDGAVVGDGGYLIEWNAAVNVDSGSGRNTVARGRRGIISKCSKTRSDCANRVWKGFARSLRAWAKALSGDPGYQPS